MKDQALHSQPQGLLVLTKGTQVEVSRDEYGLNASWFKATIIESSPKSTSNKNEQVLVEYATLFTQDKKAQLKEYVDRSHVRPLPPEDNDKGGNWSFEENDIVDAECRNGWWTGTVRKVVEDCRYMVYFDFPTDVLEFSGEELRPHWNWCNGKWTRPLTLGQRIGRSIYSSGTSVEVNVDNNRVCDAWLPAVVIKDYGDNTFFVKYKRQKNEDETVITKTIVDSAHIRPAPPCFVDRDYEFLEAVDIQHVSGWQSGSIAKVLAGRRYVVNLNHENECRELDHSKIRPHVDWVDGKWISKSTKVLIVSDSREQTLFRAGLKGIANKEGAAKEHDDVKRPSSKGIRNLTVKSAKCDGKSASYALPLSKKRKLAAADNNTLSDPSENLTGGNSDQRPFSAVKPSKEEIFSNLATASIRPRNNEKIKHFNQKSILTSGLATPKRMRTNLHKEVETECNKLEMIAKKGEHTTSPFKSPEAIGNVKEKKTVDHAAHQDINKNEDDDVSGERTNCMMKKFGIDIIEVSKDVVDDNDRPLSLWFGGTQSSKNGEESNGKLVMTETSTPAADYMTKEADMVDMVVDCFAGGKYNGKLISAEESTPTKVCIKEANMVDTTVGCFVNSNISSTVHQPQLLCLEGKDPRNTQIQCNDMTDGLAMTGTESLVTSVEANDEAVENEAMLFSKSPSLWKFVDSLYIFQCIPQNPHFRPLIKCKEASRELFAVGYMMMFSNVVEKISKLQVTDPRQKFDGYLETLAGLETHGFYVKPVVDRVNLLLSMKDKQKQLKDQSEEIKVQLAERACENVKLEASILAIDKVLSKEDWGLYKLLAKKISSDINILQLENSATNEGILTATRNFESLVTASW